MLKHKKTLILTTIVLLLPMLAGLLLWNRLPEQIPTHWNAEGVVDGWSSRGFGLFGLPGIILALHWVCVLGTCADPKKRNHAEKLQLLVLWICPVLSLLLSAITLSTAMGIGVRVEVILPVFMGVLFVIIGNYMPKCRQNYTIGIKLPWTLHNEENWNRTHRLAGFLWVIGGVLTILGALLVPDAIHWVLLPLLILMVAIPTIYSFVYDRKHPQSDK